MLTWLYNRCLLLYCEHIRSFIESKIFFVGLGREQKMRKWLFKSLGMMLCGVFVILLSMAVQKDKKQIEEQEVSSDVLSYLEELGIKNFEVEKIAEPEKVNKRVYIACTEKEINDYIAMDLENYDSLEDTDKKIVQKGDFIRIEYAMDKSMKDSKELVLKVGKNLFDKKIENALVGKKKGRIYSLRNCQNQIEYIKVESIIKYVKQTLTENFLKNTLGFLSRKEYIEHVKAELKTEKKQSAENELVNDFYAQILSKSNINLDSEEVADFCMNYYVKNEQQIAIANNKSFEDYILEMYQLKKEEYYKKIYAEGEKQIKEIIVTGILANRINYNKQEEYNVVKNAVADYYVSIEYIATDD